MLNKIIDTFTLYQFNFVNLSTLKDISNYVSFGFWFKLDYKLLIILINTLIATIILCMLFFSLLSIAERTLKQVKLINNFWILVFLSFNWKRLFYAKYFCYLTSNRKTRKKDNLPHFRLSSVENVKTWLSIRSYLKVSFILRKEKNKIKNIL
jgi:hypothetical protein